MKANKIPKKSLILIPILIALASIFMVFVEYIERAELTKHEENVISRLIAQGDLLVNPKPGERMALLIQSSTVVSDLEVSFSELSNMGRLPPKLDRELKNSRMSPGLFSPRFIDRRRHNNICWLRFDRWISSDEAIISTGEVTAQGHVRIRQLRIEEINGRWDVSEFISATNF